MQNPFVLSGAQPEQINQMTSQMAQRGQQLMSAPWMQTQQRKQEQELQQQRQTDQTVQQPGPTTGVPGIAGLTDQVSQSNYIDGADGFGSNVPRSLIGSESGGDFSETNDAKGHGGKIGHFGVLQFGISRLQDAKNSGIIPQNMTPEQFTRSKTDQVNVSNWHFNDIDKRIKSRGFDRLIGKNVGGVTLSMNGMRSMAHLGGFGGLAKFINSGGRNNPSDVNKTSLLAYGKQHQ